VQARISVVNPGAPGFVEPRATVQWDGDFKTKRERLYMTTAEEKNFLIEFIEMDSADKWIWTADARAVRCTESWEIADLFDVLSEYSCLSGAVERGEIATLLWWP